MRAKVYKMKQIQERRKGFRVAIRRSELDRRMNLMRTQLTDDFHSTQCKDFINRTCHSEPQTLFIKLENAISECLPQARRHWVLMSWQMLTSLNFKSWKTGIEGLPSLLLAIFNQLSEGRREKLSSSLIIQVLLKEMERGVRVCPYRQEQLYNMAFQLSIYASNQSKSQINFNEDRVEFIITQAHLYPTTQNLQLLTLLLINIDEECLSGKMKSKIKQIGRRISVAPLLIQDKLLILRIQTLVGTFCHFELHDIAIVKNLLDPHSDLEVPLVLRFLSKQSCELWVRFQLAQQFLVKCRQKKLDFQQVNNFLASIQNIIMNEGYEQKTVQRIYKLFFKQKLHHYINDFSIKEVAGIVVTLVIHEKLIDSEQLKNCVTNIIRKGHIGLRQLQRDHVYLLCNYLLSQNVISEAELLSYIGEEMFTDFWSIYSESQVYDC